MGSILRAGCGAACAPWTLVRALSLGRVGVGQGADRPRPDGCGVCALLTWAPPLPALQVSFGVSCGDNQGQKGVWGVSPKAEQVRGSPPADRPLCSPCAARRPDKTGGGYPSPRTPPDVPPQQRWGKCGTSVPHSISPTHLPGDACMRYRVVVPNQQDFPYLVSGKRTFCFSLFSSCWFLFSLDPF